MGQILCSGEHLRYLRSEPTQMDKMHMLSIISPFSLTHNFYFHTLLNIDSSAIYPYLEILLNVISIFHYKKSFYPKTWLFRWLRLINYYNKRINGDQVLICKLELTHFETLQISVCHRFKLVGSNPITYPRHFST